MSEKHYIGKLPLFRFCLLLLTAIAGGCASWNEEAGVDNHWRSASVPEWAVGTTTAEDVMEYLGPPSQIVDLDKQVVYYYMKESVSGSGYFLLVYNNSSSQKRYDRAIFFFDLNGVLSRYSYSKESIEYDD